jgi:hypothetical protein
MRQPFLQGKGGSKGGRFWKNPIFSANYVLSGLVKKNNQKK